MARHPILTDEEILARARSLFVERGYAARTKHIAATVGMTWGAIALRFGSKRGLFTQAMAEPMRGLDGPACEQEAEADLPRLLERLTTHLWERWPSRLQVRLAGTTEERDDEPDGLARWLGAALEAHARDGSIRSDMSTDALARVVLALLTGDVAQRFVAREPTSTADPVFIAGVVRLLSPA
jgi:AcrR family transcriptional regulator